MNTAGDNTPSTALGQQLKQRLDKLSAIAAKHQETADSLDSELKEFEHIMADAMKAQIVQERKNRSQREYAALQKALDEKKKKISRYRLYERTLQHKIQKNIYSFERLIEDSSRQQTRHVLQKKRTGLFKKKQTPSEDSDKHDTHHPDTPHP